MNTMYDNDKDISNVKIDQINNTCNFIIYCYLYSDIIKFDKEDEKINLFCKFLENDDIVIYSLIIKTNHIKLANFFVDKILSLKNTPNIILDSNIIIPVIDIIHEILILLKYWYDNLSEGNKLKNKILVGFEEFLQDITTLLIILQSIENKNSSYEKKLDDITQLLNERPFNYYSYEKIENNVIAKNKINIYTYIFNLIRQISENLIIKIIELQNVAKNDFFNVLYNKNHNPHISLLLTFSKLLESVNKRVVKFYSRFKDYYYKGVLMFKNLPEKKDHTLIMLTLNDLKEKKFIPKNTTVIGKDEINNEDVKFKTINNIQISSTKIKTIRTVSKLLNTSNKYTSSPVAVYKIGEYLMDDVYKNNMILYLFSKKRENDVNFLSTKRNTLGYSFVSKIFNLKDGERKITFLFNLDEADLIKFIKTFSEEEIIQQNTDNIISDYVNTLNNSFKLDYSSADKIISIPKENISTQWDFVNKTIILEIKLTSDMPEVSAPNGKPCDKYANNMPFIRILADNKKLFWAFYTFVNIKFKNITVSVNVTKCNNLTLQNDLGIIDTDTIFQPFGPFPRLNSMIYLTNEEIFSKKISSLKIKIKWDNLPKNGFSQYYREYNKDIDNSSFRVSISLLNGSEWCPTNEEDRQVINLFCEKSDGTLNDETVLDIDINKLRINECIKFIHNPYLTSTSIGGFIKIELISPNIAFGHNLYTKLIAKTLTEKKDKAVKDIVDIEVNSPYTPSIKKISLDYSAKTEFNKQTDNEIIINAIHPFGYFKDFPIKTLKSKKSNGDVDLNLWNTSTIYIELIDVNFTVINLYFMIDEASVHLDKINFKVGYIDKNECIFLDDNAIIEDKTNGFTQSGTIKIKKPNIGKFENTYIENNYKNSLWMAILLLEKRINLPTILGIYYNCVEVIRESKYNNPLTQLSLKSFEDKDLRDIQILQPFKSYGGDIEENDEKMYKRIKNRLQIKNRCISADDYVTFILENFNMIKYVEVVKNYDECGNINKDIEYKNQPGNVDIVVILNTSEYQENGRIFPEASPMLLSKITAKLKKYCSPFSKINIINPQYEELKVMIRVVFEDDLDQNMYIKILNNEISKFISPWLYDNNINICISKKISVIDFIIYLKAKSYIKHILNFNIVKFYKDEIICTYGFNDSIYPNSYHTIFYSSSRHEIVVDNLRCDNKNDLSIGNAHIEEDLIISAIKENREQNEGNSKVPIDETINEYFLKFK